MYIINGCIYYYLQQFKNHFKDLYHNLFNIRIIATKMSNKSKKRNNKNKNKSNSNSNQNDKKSNQSDEDASERKHWFDIMRAFLSYQDFLEFDVSRYMLYILLYCMIYQW